MTRPFRLFPADRPRQKDLRTLDFLDLGHGRGEIRVIVIERADAPLQFRKSLAAGQLVQEDCRYGRLVEALAIALREDDAAQFVATALEAILESIMRRPVARSRMCSSAGAAW